MIKSVRIVTAGLLATGLLATPVLAETIKLDAKLQSYAKTQNVAGNLNSIGSDTLNNLMTFWAEGFRKHYPNVNIQIEGKGSSTAPPALIEGTAQIGPMSRPMKKRRSRSSSRSTATSRPKSAWRSTPWRSM
jgi:phosphate transport system substrate-binding protein